MSLELVLKVVDDLKVATRKLEDDLADALLKTGLRIERWDGLVGLALGLSPQTLSGVSKTDFYKDLWGFVHVDPGINEDEVMVSTHLWNVVQRRRIM